MNNKYIISQLWLIIIALIFLSIWFFTYNGIDPTMDYSSLKGSELTPRDYDTLVHQRKDQYARDSKNDHDEEV